MNNAELFKTVFWIYAQEFWAYPEEKMLDWLTSDVWKWIPVKMRPMDSEEREYWEEHAGITLTDDMAQAFDCPMPDDGQRVWEQTKNGFVFDDVCDSDCDGIGLEGNGDWDDVVAWMPMLEPDPWIGESDDSILEQ